MENKENINTDKKTHGETSMEKAIMKDNKVNEELARKEGYVPVEEINEKYDPTENKEMKKVIDEDYDRIEKAAKIYLKEKLGREVKIYSMEAIYPYSAIYIGFYTLNRPTILFYVKLSIDEKRTYNESSFYGLDDETIKAELFKGIIGYAYEEEIKSMNLFIEKNFPEFYIDADMKEITKEEHHYPFVNIGHATMHSEPQEDSTFYVNKLSKLYLENPNRSAREWKELIIQMNPSFDVLISADLKGIQDLPTENKLKKLSEEFRKIPDLLPGTYEFSIKTSWRTIKEYYPLEKIKNKKYNFVIERDEE